MKSAPKIIPVKLKTTPYNIYISHNLTPRIPAYLKKLKIGDFAVIITTRRVARLYNKLIQKTFKKHFEYIVITVPDGETAKSKKWLFYVIERMIKADTLKRKLFCVCFGGGVVGDLGGFAASIYKRGVPYIQIPTTLLSQIDSSIGGKTAIDLPQAKNILGAFHQPKAVFIDPRFLSTLPTGEIKQGIAEAIKYGVIKDKNFFNFLKANPKKIFNLNSPCILRLISVCAAIKAKVVTQDEKEKRGIRTILNFGHTFAHALESTLKYKKISHGDAVALGMLFAARLSLALDECSKIEIRQIYEINQAFSLPTTIIFDRNNLYKFLCRDKKFTSGKIRMVILKKIGRVRVKAAIPGKKIKQILANFSPD